MTVNNLVLPTDNAVIDYSIISQLVNAVNSLQMQLNNLDTQVNPPKPVDPATGSPAPTTAKEKQIVSKTKFSGTSVIVKTGLNQVNAIVATPYATQSKIYAVIRSVTKGSVKFDLIGATTTSSGDLHWVAQGI